MNQKTTAILAAVVALVAAQPARAQVSISPYAGAMIYDGSVMIQEAGAYQGSGIANDPPTAVVGLRAGYAFGNGVELEASYGRSWLENGRGDVAGHLYQATVRYPVLSAGPWTVHLAAGGGGITYTMDSAPAGSLSDAAISGGLGATFRLSDALDVRTDLAFLGQFCHEPAPRDGLACNDGSQLGYTQWTAGLRFRP